MSSENLRLTLSVDFDEHGIHPAQVLIDESITASNFVMGGPTPSQSARRTGECSPPEAQMDIQSIF